MHTIIRLPGPEQGDHHGLLLPVDGDGEVRAVCLQGGGAGRDHCSFSNHLDMM